MSPVTDVNDSNVTLYSAQRDKPFVSAVSQVLCSRYLVLAPPLQLVLCVHRKPAISTLVCVRFTLNAKIKKKTNEYNSIATVKDCFSSHKQGLANLDL